MLKSLYNIIFLFFLFSSCSNESEHIKSGNDDGINYGAGNKRNLSRSATKNSSLNQIADSVNDEANPSENQPAPDETGGADIYEPGPDRIGDSSGFASNFDEHGAEYSPKNIADKDSAAAYKDSIPPQLGLIPVERQKQIANEIFAEISNAGSRDYELQKKLYKRLIKDCPDTKEAQIAYYRLANIFLYNESDIDYNAVVALLKDFPKNYPKSSQLPVIIPILIRAYEETEQWQRVTELYAWVFSGKMILSDNDYVNFTFKYAQALEKIHKPAEAVRWYKKTIERPGAGNAYIISQARTRLTVLDTAKK